MAQKFLFCVGTRPEAIKLAPLVLAAQARGYDARLLSTGQHREMLDPIFKNFGLVPFLDLSVLHPNQSLASLTSVILAKTSEVLKSEKPDLVFVQGDTTTALATSFAAFYEKIPVAHVEAGLRTHDPYSPFPEEMNRKVIGDLATYHFAPTQMAKQNLLREGITKNVWVTGNTGIDALRITAEKIASPASAQSDEKKILVTCHRRETHGAPLLEICSAILELAKKYPNLKFVFPVHLNPNVHKAVTEKLGQHSQIELLAPLPYPEFSKHMKESFVILTDSGGIQEEAPYFGKPIFVMRESTERPEGIHAGVAELVGSDQQKIVERVSKAIENQAYYQSFQKSLNPYGDGHSSDRILDLLASNG